LLAAAEPSTRQLDQVASVRVPAPLIGRRLENGGFDRVESAIEPAGERSWIPVEPGEALDPLPAIDRG
jgi:hypothetical protein